MNELSHQLEQWNQFSRNKTWAVKGLVALARDRVQIPEPTYMPGERVANYL